MADFSFNLRTHSPDVLDVVSTGLGATGDDKFRSNTDLGKAVKMTAEGTHDICAADDEIRGFVDSVKGITVNDGYSFGGVQRGGTREAVAGAAVTPALAVGDLVVADAQEVAGTKGLAQVKKGTPAKYKWEVISVKGDGETGSKVVLERV